MGNLGGDPPLIHMLTQGVAKPPGQAHRNKEPTEVFGWVRQRHEVILEYQFSVARWIMASLLLLNGGAILALLNSADRFPAALGSGIWFLGGAVLAVLSGTATWFNCNFISVACVKRLDWEALDYQDSESADRWDFWGLILGWASVFLAITSLGAFAGGAIVAKQGIVAPKPAATPPVSLPISVSGASHRQPV